MEELIADVVSSLEDHLAWKEDEPPQTMKAPDPIDIQPLRSQTPGRRRRDAFTERCLAEVREAHQTALATVATLEEEFNWLCWHITRGWLGAQAHSRSRDHHGQRSRG